MERRRKLAIAGLVLSFPLGGLSFACWVGEAGGYGSCGPVPPWIGIIVAVVLYFVGVCVGPPEHRERW
jgi:hypothetical protein